MRLVYMGTPHYAATILKRLLTAGYVPDRVYTQPDRPAGRKRRPTPPPVKEVALDAGIEIVQPEKITAEVRMELEDFAPDLIIVAAYGKILRPQVLRIPQYGCVNAHAGQLPAYRGAAPVNWTLVNGETVTAATIMLMDEGVDTGPVLGEREVPIDPDDDAGSLLEKLATTAGDLMVEILPPYLRGEIKPQPQPNEGAGYAPMLSKNDGVIDWGKPAERIVNHIRGMTPWPGAITGWRGKMIKVIQAEQAPGEGAPGTVLQAGKELVIAAGSGAVRLRRLQMQGKNAMLAAAFLNGVSINEGECFGADQSG